MKMTLDLPGDLVREMKVKAAHEGRKLKDVATESLRRGLSSTASSGKGTRRKIKLPLFQCSPDAPASRMTQEEILAAEQEALRQEDIERLDRSV